VFPRAIAGSEQTGVRLGVKGEKDDALGMLHSASSYNHGGYGGAGLLVDLEYDLVVSIYICEKDEISLSII
jgi:hypothetical protein